MRRYARALLAILLITAVGAHFNMRTSTATGAALASTAFVALGDSSTTCPDAPHPTTQSYPALLARHLPKGTKFRNLALDDTNLAGIATNELPAALRAHPALVVMWVFAHDVLLEGTSTAAYRASLDQILAALQRIHARVFIGNVPDMRAFPSSYLPNPAARAGYIRTGRAFNSAIYSVAARRGAVVVDLYAATKLLYPHPEDYVPPYGRANARGCAAVASIFYRVMHNNHVL